MFLDYEKVCEVSSNTSFTVLIFIRNITHFNLMIKYSKPADRHLLLSNLEFSYYTLNKNLKDLLATHEKYFNEQDLNVINLEKLNPFVRELTRLLHNYLASFATFVDHMRKSLKTFNNSRFEKEYNREKEKIGIVERTLFLKRLRNFVQHKQLPIVGLRVSLV